MKIRKASKHDVPTIANIHSVSWQENYRSVLSKQYLEDRVPMERMRLWKDRFEHPKSNQQVFLAEVEGNIAGFICLYMDNHPDWGTHLDNLHVRKGYHSMGVGKALFIEGARRAYQQAPHRGMCLLVNQDNIKAQSFYQKLGGRQVQESIWHAPDGSKVPTYWYIWEQLNELVDLDQ
ncbi:GNAT family N-acetyltransferase [Microbulbifer sp. CnH-101-E]|uniref:GNAT family N-acetyltransferase n=1 Tax=Microbulbifer variabilis TaxID=266805 RepID=A0ABY4VCB8_9GAMM|nr:GNAT family N-acetyltransferase [Microbulbifer variabilis]USD21901.1 GNAT family N-acetyltransferase [Microbulbifer variabilis]